MGRLGTAGMVVALVASGLGARNAQAQGVDTLQVAVEPDSSLLTPAVIDAGRKLFHGKGTCTSCHGDKLQGGPVAPPLLGKSWKHIDGSFDAIVNRIDEGYPGSVMVPHPGGVSESQVHLLAVYVWAVSHGKAKP
jgi:mono/diheme cytochrome c family protein